MDYGNYKLNQKYEYTEPDPSKNKLGGLMTTDYNKLRKDLQTPGDLQINKTYDTADYNIRDVMGGGGMYGSSIHSNAISNNARQRADSLAANAAGAGATTEQLRSQNNQWLGNATLDSARMANAWNLSQDQMNKGLMNNMIMGDLGNQWTLGQMDKQGEWGLKQADKTGQWGMNQVNAQNDANESSAMWSGLGTLAGGLLGSDGFWNLF